MSSIFRQQLREEIDLAAPMAAWIVATHVFVLACPLALIWAVHEQVQALTTVFANTFLVQVASAVYIGATAFEVAQNAADRWYLTEATRSLADLFFNGFMTLAFSLFTFGFIGPGVLAWLTVVLTLAYPLAYIADHPAHRGLSGGVVLIATYAFFQVTGDPVVWLFLLGNVIGIYFISLMIARHAQFLHGLGALFFGLGFLSWPWAVLNAAAGHKMTWGVFGVIAGVCLLVMLALYPWLAKLPATPRRA